MNEPTTKREKKRRALPPALLRRTEAAAYCGQSPATWDRHNGLQLTPEAIRLGGCLAWGREELREWIRHHCPPRAEWQDLWRKLRDKK